MDTTRRICLNVGGKIFMTTTDTLQSLPDTRLGRLTRDDTVITQQDVELFFDRNPKIMNSLLDLYRTGELHVPKNLCARTVERELEFWEIPGELIQECCFRGFNEHKEDAAIIAEIDKFLSFPYDSPGDFEKLSTRGKIWLMMEQPRLCLVSRVWGIFYFTVVAWSVLLLCLGTSMSFRRIHPQVQRNLAENNISWEQALSNMSLVDTHFVTLPELWIFQASDLVFFFFLLEFLVRFFVCPKKGFFVRQHRNRLEMFLLVQNAVTFFLEKVYIEKVFHSSNGVPNFFVLFYSLSALKMLRILHVIKDFDVMKVLLLSTKASLKVLMLLAVCLVSLATLYGTAVYLVELLTKNHTFHTIPHGMWYAVVTMTTVGYGDVIPMGSLGRIVGVLCAFSGVITIALPVAVIASKFSKYHDNLASRTQLRSRVVFLKECPDFLLQKEEERVKECPDFLNQNEGKTAKEHPHFQRQKNEKKRVKERLNFPCLEEDKVKECPDFMSQNEEKRVKEVPDFMRQNEEKRVKEVPDFMRQNEEKRVKEVPDFMRQNEEKRVKEVPDFMRQNEEKRVKEVPDFMPQNEKKRVKGRPDFLHETERGGESKRKTRFSASD